MTQRSAAGNATSSRRETFAACVETLDGAKDCVFMGLVRDRLLSRSALIQGLAIDGVELYFFRRTPLIRNIKPPM